MQHHQLLLPVRVLLLLVSWQVDEVMPILCPRRRVCASQCYLCAETVAPHPFCGCIFLPYVCFLTHPCTGRKLSDSANSVSGFFPCGTPYVVTDARRLDVSGVLPDQSLHDIRLQGPIL